MNLKCFFGFHDYKVDYCGNGAFDTSNGIVACAIIVGRCSRRGNMKEVSGGITMDNVTKPLEEKSSYLTDDDIKRLSQIHLSIADLVTMLIEYLHEQNYNFHVYCGIRSYEEQEALYNKGRDADGNIVSSDDVVTNAKPGSSWHNFGLAVDLVRINSKGNWVWDYSTPGWKVLADKAVELGLVAGANFQTIKDPPHVQKTGTLSLAKARELYKIGGYSAVWKEIA